jgi:hypothetical protein
VKRKVDVYGVIGRVIGLYGNRFGSLLGAGLAMFCALIAIVFALGFLAAVGGVRTRSGLLMWLLLILAAFVITWAAYHAGVIKIAQLARNGRSAPLGAVLSAVTPRIGALILAEVLIMASVFGLLVLSGVMLGSAGTGLGLLLVLFPGLYFASRFALTIPIVVLEGKSAMDAMERSWKMAASNVWRIFALLLIALLASVIVQIVLRVVLVDMTAGSQTGQLLNGLITQLLLAPLFALLTAVIYLDLNGLQPEAATPIAPPSQGIGPGAVPGSPAIPIAGAYQATPNRPVPPQEAIQPQEAIPGQPAPGISWDTSKSVPPPPPGS